MFTVIFLCVVGCVLSPFFTEFTENKERRSFAEGFFKPLVLVANRLEVSTDVGEFVSKLIDTLRVVVVSGVELNGNFSAWSPLKESNRTSLMFGNKE